ncbi:MAG: FAD-dependent oxidoreductase [Gammaproteobacteria bacterium CG22_combo_CG10-13_8_21_14_all_40_8]|nr:MAG: FAD-dependent oxidoreductase [Gammaproteobacteria bacterium CG22_combo_CG10-13_8_21_14_all_40_8]
MQKNKSMENYQINRSQRLQKMQQIQAQKNWDLLIIGGGITGAGIFKLASQLGLKALLLEQKDFAWGSSSRSSKMVHGGLRYMADGQMKLTIESVKQRQKLLEESQGLVQKQSFVLSHYAQKFPWPWIFNLLLIGYDFFAGKKQHQYWPKKHYQFLAPGIQTHQNLGGTQFLDAMTDDARLVYRLIQEGEQLGNLALNYIKVQQLKKCDNRVTGVVAKAEESNDLYELDAKFVINATGAWANELMASQNKSFCLRPLRGSHFIVANWRLPVASAVSVPHPDDKRPVQIFPWQNVTVVGTTDVEHHKPLSQEPCISPDELAYLLRCVDKQFPTAQIKPQDIISTFAGVRPIVVEEDLQSNASRQQRHKDQKIVSPSKEKREHSICQQPGLISIAGGKLTIFNQIAQEVLAMVFKELNGEAPEFNQTIFEQFDAKKFAGVRPPLSQPMRDRLCANYGLLAQDFIQQIEANLLSPISYSLTLWGELVWALKYEQIVHLDDLMLRRSRLGNILPHGGLKEMSRIKNLCQRYLGWNEGQWQHELARYQSIWKSCYSLPEPNILTH